MMPLVYYFATKSSSRYRLVYYPGSDDIGELYDHRQDPDECRNIWEAPEHLAIRLRLTEIALTHLARHRRHYSFAEDSKASASTPAQRVQSGRESWSDLKA